MGSLEKKMHLVGMSSLSILFQAKSMVLQNICKTDDEGLKETDDNHHPHLSLRASHNWQSWCNGGNFQIFISIFDIFIIRMMLTTDQKGTLSSTNIFIDFDSCTWLRFLVGCKSI